MTGITRCDRIYDFTIVGAPSPSGKNLEEERRENICIYLDKFISYKIYSYNLFILSYLHAIRR